MIILDDTKSLSVLANDTSNGLGQIGCINPTITENLNGSYELEFDIATSEKYFSLLKVGGLVKCLHNTSEQIFRIYFISKAINGIVNVKAQHITYDLTGVVVKPFTATGAVSSVNGMLSNVIGSTPFTMTTDITNTTSVFTLDIPRSFRECLGGYEGSLLDVFRGEYEWDNLTVKMLAHRGADNGVRIAYGKNLTDFTQEENIENVFDAVYGYAVIDDVFYQPSGIYNKTGATTPKVKIVDFSSDYESGDTPSQADLYAKAQTYATNNPIEVPNVNIKVSFVPLWQTEEYKNILPLERVSLGDTVHVFFEKLNVEATARVIKTVWNVNLNRYDEIELGDARANLNTVINESVDSAVNNAIGDLDIDTGAIESEMMRISSLIANGLGLRLTKDSQGRIYLHNAETLALSQYQYMITATGFMLSDDYGQTWSSGWTTSGDVVVNALSTNIIRALQIYGSFLRFGDANTNYIDVAPYSENNVPMGVSFDGTGYVRFQPQEQFIVNNLDSNDNLLNEFVLGASGSNNQAFITLKNYDYTNHLLANAIDMDARLLENTYYYNRLHLTNYETFSSDKVLANEIVLQGRTSNNENNLNLNNYVPQTTRLANVLQFRSYNYESGGINWKGHTVALTNYKEDAQNEANKITMSTQQASMRLYNYNRGSNAQANLLELSSNGDLMNTLRMQNFKKNGSTGSDYANEILMTGYAMNPGGSYANRLQIRNYDVDGNNVAEYIQMEKYTNRNLLKLCLNRGGYEVAFLSLDRQGTEQGYMMVNLATTTNNGYYKYSGLLLNGNGDASIDAETSIRIGGGYSGTTLNIMGHQIYFSGGYVRYN